MSSTHCRKNTSCWKSNLNFYTNTSHPNCLKTNQSFSEATFQCHLCIKITTWRGFELLYEYKVSVTALKQICFGYDQYTRQLKWWYYCTFNALGVLQALLTHNVSLGLVLDIVCHSSYNVNLLVIIPSYLIRIIFKNIKIGFSPPCFWNLETFIVQNEGLGFEIVHLCSCFVILLVLESPSVD